MTRYCYPQCRDPFFNECADCWQSGGNPALEPSSVRPATRVGRTVIHQGGAITRLSLPAWALYVLGWKRAVRTP